MDFESALASVTLMLSDKIVIIADFKTRTEIITVYSNLIQTIGPDNITVNVDCSSLINCDHSGLFDGYFAK